MGDPIGEFGLEYFGGIYNLINILVRIRSIQINRAISIKSRDKLIEVTNFWPYKPPTLAG